MNFFVYIYLLLGVLVNSILHKLFDELTGIDTSDVETPEDEIPEDEISEGTDTSQNNSPGNNENESSDDGSETTEKANPGNSEDESNVDGSEIPENSGTENNGNDSESDNESVDYSDTDSFVPDTESQIQETRKRRIREMSDETLADFQSSTSSHINKMRKLNDIHKKGIEEQKSLLAYLERIGNTEQATALRNEIKQDEDLAQTTTKNLEKDENDLNTIAQERVVRDPNNPPELTRDSDPSDDDDDSDSDK